MGASYASKGATVSYFYSMVDYLTHCVSIRKPKVLGCELGWLR
jgi:hypothetical protein